MRQRGILVFWRAFGEGACLRPVTEPKRSQNPKEPLPFFFQPHGYSIFENAIKLERCGSISPKARQCLLLSAFPVRHSLSGGGGCFQRFSHLVGFFDLF
jgi:hypothetical protein